MQRTHDQQEPKKQPQQKKARLQKYEGEDRLVVAVRSALCNRENPEDPVLSSEPLLLCCVDEQEHQIMDLVWWPVEQATGERVLKKLQKVGHTTQQHKEHCLLVRALIDKASGFLVELGEAAEFTQQEASRDEQNKVLERVLAGSELGYLAFIDDSRPVECLRETRLVKVEKLAPKLFVQLCYCDIKEDPQQDEEESESS
jgi:hypothetical protein